MFSKNGIALKKILYVLSAGTIVCANNISCLLCIVMKQVVLEVLFELLGIGTER